MDSIRVCDLYRSVHDGHIYTTRRGCGATCGAIVQGAGCVREPQTGPKRETLPAGRDDVVRGPEGARGDAGGAPPGQASDVMDPRGLQRFGQRHRRQDGGEPARQPRLPHSRWPQEQDVIGIILASRFSWLLSAEAVAGMTVNFSPDRDEPLACTRPPL
jgi:hypothetical protein